MTASNVLVDGTTKSPGEERSRRVVGAIRWGLMLLIVASGAYHAPLRAQAAVQLVEVQRIKGDDQDLSTVALVARGGDGTIWISQPQDHNVVGFSADGVKVRVIGRRGEGPGSFGGPPSGLIPSADGIIVFDRQLQRVTRFGREGSRVETTPIVRPEGLPGPSRAPLRAVGLSHVYYLSDHRPQLVSEERNAAPAQAKVHTATIGGSALRLLVTFDYRSCGLGVQTAARQISVGIPFCHQAHYKASPAGSILALAEPVELGQGMTAVDVRIFAVNGTLLSRSRHQLGSSILPKRSVDSVVAIFRQRITDPEGTSILNEIVQGGYIPNTYPPVTAVTVSDDGEAWVTTRSGPRGAAGVLVIRRDGSLRGSLALAPGSRIGWAGDGHVLIVEEQPDGLQDVVLYRLAFQ